MAIMLKKMKGTNAAPKMGRSRPHTLDGMMGRDQPKDDTPDVVDLPAELPADPNWVGGGNKEPGGAAASNWNDDLGTHYRSLHFHQGIGDLTDSVDLSGGLDGGE